jgi:pimeloyl-ACP methyl ester carboxylesterase
MAANIDGALYREVVGPAAAPLMVFVHPNPMDNAAWMYQLAHFSTWYRCVAVDLPGYGRSPRARPGVTLFDLAEACWDAVEAESAGPAVLVGCSIGTNVVLHMEHLHPERTAAVVVSGASYATEKPHLQRHVDAYSQQGVEYRHDYALQDFSPAFRSTPLAEWMAGLWTERNEAADVPSILAMFEALIQGDPPWFSEVETPVLILTGSEDAAHQRAFALRDVLPDAELVTLDGAGHACQLEQPWEFDRQLLDFLDRRVGLPSIARPAQHPQSP